MNGRGYVPVSEISKTCPGDLGAGVRACSAGLGLGPVELSPPPAICMPGGQASREQFTIRTGQFAIGTGAATAVRS